MLKITTIRSGQPEQPQLYQTHGKVRIRDYVQSSVILPWSVKLMLLLSLAPVGFIALLLISASALHRNLMSEREARLQAVLDLAMSGSRPWPPPSP